MKIACHLSEPLERLLATHPSRPEIVPYTRGGKSVWEIPPDADVLFTFAMGWRNAPKDPPPGWPFRLRYIQIAAAGVDAFPPWFFSGPTVSCGRGIASVPIAEYVMAAILAREKRWAETRVGDASQWQQIPLGHLEGKTLGLIGAGAIGHEVAKRAAAFGMRVIGVRRSGASGDALITIVPTLAELLAQSDHAVVAAPLTDATRGLVGRDALAAAKPGLHLINVSRGQVIDDDALLAALRSGRVGGATLDVTHPEPLPAGHPYYDCPQVWITSHISWSSENGDERIAAKLLDNLERHQRGEPLLDVVDAARGY
jgi:phosphoglycerate dehydrogenase-like enzyme